MSIADDLNSIRTHLEDDYEALEQLGVSVEDRNIENIKDMANQIYAKFPKTEYQEGTEVNLGKTIKGKLDYDNGVVGIGQSSQDSTKGYQLFDISSNRTDTNCTSSVVGNKLYQNNSTNYCRTAWKMEGLVVGTSYILKLKYSNPNACSIQARVMDSTNTNVVTQTSATTNTSGTLELTFTPTETTHYIRFYSNTLSTTNTYEVIFEEIMLESGTIAHEWEPYTNGASPNPSYKQEIKGVKGKNLWGGLTYTKTTNGITFVQNEDGSMKVSGTATADAMSILSRDVGSLAKKLAPGTYTLSGGRQEVKLDAITPSGSTLASTTYNVFEKSFVVTEETECFVRGRVLSGAVVDTTVYIQLEEGSQATSYLPYNTVEYKERGKNLFDKNAVPVITNNLPITILDTGVRIANIQNNTSYVFCNYKIMDLTNYVGKTIRAKANFTPSGNNTAKYYIGLCDVNGNNRVQKANGNVSGETISYEVTEISGNSKYLCIVLYANNGGNALKDDYVDFTDLIITIDDEDMSYEPYITPTSYQLSLGDRKIFEGDYFWIDRSTGKKYQHHKMGEIDITSTGTLWETFEYYNGVILTNNNPTFYDNSITPLCNYFIYGGTASSSSNAYSKGNNKFCLHSSDGKSLYFRNDDLANKEAWTTWLSTHPINLVVGLATETDTEITDTTLINQLEALYNAHSLNGTTIITSNGDLPMILKVRALKGE